MHLHRRGTRAFRLDWLSLANRVRANLFERHHAAELAHGVERANTPERRETRARFVGQVEARYPLLPFEREEALEYARLWAELATRGLLIGTHDQLIAAIAPRHGYRVATLNAADFNRVPGLSVLDAGAFSQATA